MRKSVIATVFLFTAITVLSGPVAAALPTVAEINAKYDMDIESLTPAEQVAFCDNLQVIADELDAAAPMQLDEATVLQGGDIRFTGGTCVLGINYDVDEAKLFELLQQSVSSRAGQDVPLEFVQALYTEVQGVGALRQALQHNILSDPTFADFIAIPFMAVEGRYRFNGEHLEDFTVVLSRELLEE